MPADERNFVTDIHYHRIAEMELKKRLQLARFALQFSDLLSATIRRHVRLVLRQRPGKDLSLIHISEPTRPY